MTEPDITVIVTFNREGLIASFTLRSLADTALHAASKGLTVELVAILDRPDAVTRHVVHDFDSAAFVRIERIEVANGSTGPSRNAGLAAARGAYVAVADGDDLYSLNYLAAMHEVARGGSNVVAHPEFVVWFGEAWLVQRFVPLAQSGRFRLAGHHTFASCILAPTALLRDVGYRDSTGNRAYAYEDYDFTLRLVAAGADFRTAGDALFFYRRHGRSIMAAIADPLRFLAPPSAFYEPEAFLAAGEGQGDLVDDPDALNPGVLAFRASHQLAELVRHAATIEPRVDLAKVREATIYTTAHFGRGFGATYAALCRQLRGTRFEAVVVVADLALCPRVLATAADARWLVIAMEGGTPTLGGAAQVVTLGRHAPALPAQRRAEMAVRLIHGFAAHACLHVILDSAVDGLLNSFVQAFERNPIVLYDLGPGQGRAWTLESDVFAAIDVVASDEEAILDTLVTRLPVYASKVMTIDARNGDDWLASTAARLRPRPKDTRWTPA